MALSLYWASGSAPAWRALLAVEFKQLDYQSRLLEASKKEHKQPEFLALNPRGQFPVLTDDEVVVYETRAIMHYLDAKYPIPRLFGDQPNSTARIERQAEEILTYTDPAVTKFVQPVFRSKVEQVEHQLPAAAKEIHGELKAVNDVLRNAEWLSGDDYRAADIMLIPTMQRLVRAIGKAPDLAEELGLRAWRTEYEALARWHQAVETLPAFDRTFPPHWRT